jgi:Holliday junction resolvase
MNCKAKGSRAEAKSRRMLGVQGYSVTKSGGSLGLFDLIGISRDSMVCVQVKANRGPRSVEMEALRAFACPPGCRKEVHIWRDRCAAPQIRKL